MNSNSRPWPWESVTKALHNYWFTFCSKMMSSDFMNWWNKTITVIDNCSSILDLHFQNVWIPREKNIFYPEKYISYGCYCQNNFWFNRYTLQTHSSTAGIANGILRCLIPNHHEDLKIMRTKQIWSFLTHFILSVWRGLEWNKAEWQSKCESRN